MRCRSKLKRIIIDTVCSTTEYKYETVVRKMLKKRRHFYNQFQFSHVSRFLCSYGLHYFPTTVDYTFRQSVLPGGCLPADVAVERVGPTGAADREPVVLVNIKKNMRRSKLQQFI